MLGADVPGCILGWELSQTLLVVGSRWFTGIRADISAVDRSQESDPAGAIIWK